MNMANKSGKSVRSAVFICVVFFTTFTMVKFTKTNTATPESQNRRALSESKRKLEFLHIPKNGGSAIEIAAREAGVTWGVCHFRQARAVGCNNEPDIPRDIEMTEFQNHFGNRHHVPLQFYAKNPFEDADTFAVLRNPYSRYVSEYYCLGLGGDDENNPDVMNRALQERIPQEFDHTHFLPQHHYIYDSTGRKMVDHVLSFENLHEDFSQLMETYDLDVKLHPKPAKYNYESSRLTTKDLYPETIAIINRVAAQDFVLGGYEMVTSMDEP